MFESLSIRHVPALVAGFTLTVGGLAPFIDAQWAIKQNGLSTRIQNSPAAVPPMILFGARTSAFGACIAMFYAKGEFEAVDTVFLTIPFAGFVESYIAWKEGSRGTAVLRIITGLFFGACGLSGLTASSR